MRIAVQTLFSRLERRINSASKVCKKFNVNSLTDNTYYVILLFFLHFWCPFRTKRMEELKYEHKPYRKINQRISDIEAK